MECSLSCAYKLRVSEQGVNGLCSGIAGPRDRAAATVGVGPRLTHGQPRRLHQERVRARRFHVRGGVVGGPRGLAPSLARGPRQLVDRGLLADTAALGDAQRFLAGALHVRSRIVATISPSWTKNAIPRGTASLACIGMPPMSPILLPNGSGMLCQPTPFRSN